jgi:hypothetical protein
MKWPLYLLFASVTFSAGITALSRGWNLPPPATAGKPAPGSSRGNEAQTKTADSEELPACCAGRSHKAKSDADSPAIFTAITNEAGEVEIVPPCCAGKKHTGN